jgi:hypothetical protein
MCISDMNIEFAKLESTENVGSAQAATATSHKEWLDIQSADVSAQKGLFNLFSSGRAQKQKPKYEKDLEYMKIHDVFQDYYKQGDSRKSDHWVNLMQF